MAFFDDLFLKFRKTSTTPAESVRPPEPRSATKCETAPQKIPSHADLYKLIQQAHKPETSDKDIAYPKPLQYVSAKHPSDMIKGQAFLLSHISIQSGFQENEFIRYILKPVENFAAWVQLLPASENYHHISLGGLFAHSLDVGLRALKIFENRNLYVEGTAVSREGNLQRFRLACFLGGMLHDIGKIFEDIIIVNRDGDVWCSQLEPLYEWANRTETKDYKFIWRKGRYLESHELYTPYYVPKIIPLDVLKYLSEGDPNVSRILIGCLSSNTADVYGRMGKIIEIADSSSTEYDIKHKKINANASEYQYPIGSTFLSIIRQMLANGELGANVKGGQVYVTDHGAFILWTEKFFSKLVPLLTEKGFPATTKRLELAKLLVESTIARVNEITNEEGTPEAYPLWKIRIEEGGEHYALRLSKVQSIFPEGTTPTDMVSIIDMKDEDKRAFGTLDGAKKEKSFEQEPQSKPEANQSHKDDAQAQEEDNAVITPLKTNQEPDDAPTEDTEDEDSHDLDEDFFPTGDEIDASKDSDQADLLPGVEVEVEDDEPLADESIHKTTTLVTTHKQITKRVITQGEEDVNAEASNVKGTQEPVKADVAKHVLTIHQLAKITAYPVKLKIADALLVNMSRQLRQEETFSQPYLQVIFEFVLAKCTNKLSVEAIQDGQKLPTIWKDHLANQELSDEALTTTVFMLPNLAWLSDTTRTGLSVGVLATIVGGRTETVTKALEAFSQKKQLKLVKLTDGVFDEPSVLNYRNLVSEAMRKVGSSEPCTEAIIFENTLQFVINNIEIDFDNARQGKQTTFELSKASIEGLRKLTRLFEKKPSNNKKCTDKKAVAQPEPAQKAQVPRQRVVHAGASIDLLFESLRVQIMAKRGPWVDSLKFKDNLWVLQDECFELMAKDYPEFSAQRIGNKIRENPGFMGFRIRGTQVMFDPASVDEEEAF